MSWSIKKIGTREGVRLAVDLDTNLPSTVKAAILNHLGQEPNAPTGVRVEGYGHHNAGDSCCSGIGKLEIEPFELSMSIPPVAVQETQPTKEPVAETEPAGKPADDGAGKTDAAA